MKNKVFAALFFVLCIALRAWAQPPNDAHNMVEPSPEAYSLGKYGLIPADKYTGAAVVSIPLHEMVFGDLRIPITLTYSSSGLRPQEEASWVGLGWSLAAAPIITRQIKECSDFKSNGGWINQPDYDLETRSPVSAPPEVSADITNYGLRTVSRPDLEPDIFVANIFGATFKFILINKAANGGVVGVRFLNNVTYKATFNEQQRTFEVTDDRGYRYLFNIKELSTISYNRYEANDLDNENSNYEVPSPDLSWGSESPDVDIPITWYCSKITSPAGETLDFVYERPYRSMSQPSVSGTFEAFRCFGSSPPTIKPSVSWSRTAIDHIVLSQIVNQKEVLTFNTTERLDLAQVNFDNRTTDLLTVQPKASNTLMPTKLTTISIRYNNVPKKTIRFTHTYFNQAKSASAYKDRYLRLKLDAVQVNDRKYTFSYTLPESLPSKITKSVDYWGFYNGRPNSVWYPSFYREFTCTPVGMPAQNNRVNIKGANKEADPYYTSMGMLARVQYPTGGVTEFGYGGHTTRVEGGSYHETEVPAFYEPAVIARYYGQDSSPLPREFPFSLGRPTLFTTSPINAAMTATIVRNGAPLAHFLANNPQAEKTAIELIHTTTGQRMWVMTFREYSAYVYGQGFCKENDRYCYTSTASKSLYTTLPAGNYVLRLYAITYVYEGPDLDGDGQPDRNPANLDTEVTMRIPEASLAGAPAFRNMAVGGVRIEVIRDLDQDNAVLSERLFSYSEPDIQNYKVGITSGRLMNQLANVTNKAYFTYQGNFPILVPSETVIVHSSPTAPMHNAAKGAHIGYGRVTETFSSRQSQSKNYKVATTYYNDPNTRGIMVAIGDGYSSLAEPVSFNNTNGNVRQEEHFDNYGSKAQDIVYDYTNLKLGSVAALKTILTFHDTRTNDGQTFRSVSFSAFQYYYHNIEKYVCTRKTTTTLSTDLQSSFVEEENYGFNSAWYPSHTAIKNSAGEEQVVRTYYVGDFSSLSTLAGKNIVSLPVKRETLVDGNMVGGDLTLYNDVGYAVSSYSYESNVLRPSNHASGVLIPDGFTKKAEYAYLTFGQLKQYQEENNIPITYLWGYNNTHIVAKVEGYSYETVKGVIDQTILDNPASDDALRAELAKLRTTPTLTGASVATYTFDPLVGMTSQTDAMGITTYFEYDAYGRLSVIKDRNRDVINVYDYNFSKN